ncbi:DUF2490 domain-containing protein [Hymenobacter sp. CRA2]|uniref:DUF2490 domain-containing protein n=1 Tax=Hymenobacter sp. CRA2 TaxID=1955620 RepID=UPI00098EB20F|nr:DUF2490 domain-containing protein [Hymenobacter sp. CRA2]OON66926.1 hypothetical protein B0919_20275 [Hymenobacter sp. CRA2]
MCTSRIVTGFATALLTAAGGTAVAQRPANAPQPWGTWGIFTLLLPGNTEHKWGGYAEVQARSNGLLRQYFYHEVKAGVSYDLDPNFTFMVAGGRYSTSDYQDLGTGPLNVEKRLWEQLVLNQYMKRLKVEHRYRVEQRWFSYRGDSTGFRQRLRYRLNAFLPLNAPTITAKTFFLSAYDEIFLNPKGPVFERNRVYAGIGYQFNKHVVLQLGWVNQANYNVATVRQGQYVPQNTAAKNNVVLSVMYRLAHRTTAEAPERLPSQQD